MKDKVYLVSNKEVQDACASLAKFLYNLYPTTNIKLYGVPRGGVPAVYALGSAFNKMNAWWSIVSEPAEATIIVDDLIDSGATMEKYKALNTNAAFVALFRKESGSSTSVVGMVLPDKWLAFPWEVGNDVSGIEDNIVRLLQYVGEDPDRGGLLETPKRVAKAWDFWTSGYGKNPQDVLKVFEDGAENCDEMIVVRDLPFYTHCEHHLAPFFGTATIAYIPNGKIVGLSKLSRILDLYARRLQVQERLTNQVADALWENLDPLGVGVIIKARHLCMESRGICQQGHHTLTSSLRGVMREQAETRQEFLSLAK